MLPAKMWLAQLLLVAVLLGCALGQVHAYPRFAQLQTELLKQLSTDATSSPSAAPVFPTVAGAAPISTLPPPLRPGLVSFSPVPQLAPNATELRAMVDRKAICPFLGAATNAKLLPIFGSMNSPYTLASSMRDLCNTGHGSDFGELVYLLALVNTPHVSITDPLSKTLGYTTLSLAGSLETHLGFSYILSGPSDQPNTGRFDPVAWKRFEARFVDGYITPTAFGHWVAENLLLDPKSKPWNVATILEDTRKAVMTGIPVLTQGAQKLLQRVVANTKNAQRTGVLQPLGPVLLSEADVVPLRDAVMATLGSNLLNAASQMAFIQTLFAYSPNTRQATATTPLGISIVDMRTMWIDRQLPAGFLTWPKKVGHKHTENAL